MRHTHPVLLSVRHFCALSIPLRAIAPDVIRCGPANEPFPARRRQCFQPKRTIRIFAALA
jgi:hypothetical protein